MPNMKTKMSVVRKALIFILIPIIFILPIVIYLTKFGIDLSNNQDIWGQFGSYISGIYAPILAILTLVILYKQYRFQKLAWEQSYAQAKANDLNYYLELLQKNLLTELSNGTTIKYTLEHDFLNISVNSLSNEKLKLIASQLYSENENFISCWHLLNTYIVGFKCYKKTTFEHFYTDSKLKLVSVIGYKCCVALDNFSYISNNGEIICKEFSSEI